jgi:uncharacterized MAPEG superfamily protein
MNDLWSSSAVQLFAICYLILVLKMMVLGSYTSTIRIRRKVFATPEDYNLQGVEPSSGVDPDIERARRAHRNDLENILPFFGVGLFYALTQPSAIGAQICFIGFTVARFLHTLFYVRSQQPHRTIVFLVGYVLMVWMAVAAGYSILTA